MSLNDDENRTIMVWNVDGDRYRLGPSENLGNGGTTNPAANVGERQDRLVSLGTRPTVLVADDEAHIVDFLALLLQDEGCRVLRAFDGVQAWNLSEQHHPDLIISDVMMPGLTGLDLARRIKRAHNGSSPSIGLMSALTGFVDMDGVQFLLKPFDIEQILTIIDHLDSEPKPY